MAMAVLGPLAVVGHLSHLMLYRSRSSPKTLHFDICPCVHHMKPMGPGPLSDPTERNLYPGGGWRPCGM